jgi:hypothetical protein
MNKQDPGHLYSEPFRVVVEGAAVVILGPNAVAVALTPEAALQSARNLEAAARQAIQDHGPRAPVLPIVQD